MVKGRGLRGQGVDGDPTATTGVECHAACEKYIGCNWWSRLEPEGCRFFNHFKNSTAEVSNRNSNHNANANEDANANGDGGDSNGGIVGASITPPPSNAFVDCGAPEDCEYGPSDCEYGKPATDPFPGPVMPPPSPVPKCSSTSTACFTAGQGLVGGDCCGGVAHVAAADTACQAACQAKAGDGCEWWVRRGTECHLKSTKGTPYDAAGVDYGPRCCPAPPLDVHQLPAFFHLW